MFPELKALERANEVHSNTYYELVKALDNMIVAELSEEAKGCIIRLDKVDQVSPRKPIKEFFVLNGETFYRNTDGVDYYLQGGFPTPNDLNDVVSKVLLRAYTIIEKDKED